MYRKHFRVSELHRFFRICFIYSFPRLSLQYFRKSLVEIELSTLQFVYRLFFLRCSETFLQITLDGITILTVSGNTPIFFNQFIMWNTIEVE